MTKPHLGITIVIDNVSTPGSEADIAALQDAHETAGFEVHSYSNCDSKARNCLMMYININNHNADYICWLF